MNGKGSHLMKVYSDSSVGIKHTIPGGGGPRFESQFFHSDPLILSVLIFQENVKIKNDFVINVMLLLPED